MLTRNNPAVYKQLYRAAKSKTKLKLRVSVEQKQKQNSPEQANVRRVTIEDEPEASTKTDGKLSRSEESMPTVNHKHQTIINGVGAVKHKQDNAKAAEPPVCPATGAFAVFCNSCDKTIPAAHYHCSTCDDGDFDLCQDCVNQGISCYNPGHWLIKRSRNNGEIVYSVTERIAPKPKTSKIAPKVPEVPEPMPYVAIGGRPAVVAQSKRTCNCCVVDSAESNFLHCLQCEDFDLCGDCFSGDKHGHDPSHAFAPAVEGTLFPDHIKVKLSPGRNQAHNAICDGCDKVCEDDRVGAGVTETDLS